MAPRVVLIRHAQALHNLENKHDIHDPLLTDGGIEQCAALRDNLKQRFGDVSEFAIIASPMRRTLQTAQLTLDWLIERGARIEASADWQENEPKPCDTGSPASVLREEFPSVDFSNLDAVWPDKTSEAGRRYAYNKQALLARGKRCISQLSQRPEKIIFVVSHSGFMRLGVVGRWFFNADYRIFDVEGSPEDPALREDESTSAGGLGLSRIIPVELGSGVPEEESTSTSA